MCYFSAGLSSLREQVDFTVVMVTSSLSTGYSNSISYTLNHVTKYGYCFEFGMKILERNGEFL